MLEIIKWFATLFIIVGVALTGLDIYPYGSIAILIGSIMWFVAGIIMNDAPIIMLNGVTSIVGATILGFKYISGV